MIIPFNCPNCNSVIQAQFKGLRHKLVTCPSCNRETQMPDNIEIGPGVVIGSGYKLEKKVGHSHLGEIFLALKEPEGRLVRIEILSGSVTSDEESVTRFLQEIELMSSLQHPNLLSAVEAGQDGDTYFLVTAHEPGQSLEEIIKRDGKVEEKKILNYIISIAEVLQYTWDQRKLLHRDLKPQNIFITESGVAKLTGFGIAKSSEGQSLGLTGVGFTIGTPEYMSPEQIRASDDLDFRSDLYALGVVMYEALVGELPFTDNAPILLMQKHMDEIPIPVKDRNPAVSSGCSALIDKMLAKEPNDRQATWNELIAHARGVIESPGKDAGKAPGSTAADSAKPLQAKSPLAMVGIGVAVVVIILIIILVMKVF